MKKNNFKKGFGFGMSSGVITTLGVIIGLYSTTKSLIVVLGGIISVAIADAFSDAFGMHISEESTGKSNKDVWRTTVWTFFSKLFFATTFLILFLLFKMQTAIIVSIFYGFILIGVYTYKISKGNGRNYFRAIGEHLLIAVVVIVIVYFVGDLVNLISNI